jgi:hypothetical protein
MGTRMKTVYCGSAMRLCDATGDGIVDAREQRWEDDRDGKG